MLANSGEQCAWCFHISLPSYTSKSVHQNVTELSSPTSPISSFLAHMGGPNDLVESELLGCHRLSTRTRTIYVNEKENERILRGEDNAMAYSQDRYIFHVVYIHHVDSVAVESMHGTNPRRMMRKQWCSECNRNPK
jgi:hypothetical protein